MGEVGYEGGSVITDYFFRKSVMMPDVLQEQLGDSGGVQGGDCGYGMNLLRQAIHHHEDGIVPFGVWEFSDHVYGDHLPASVRDLVGKVFVWLHVSHPAMNLATYLDSPGHQ